MSNTRWAIYSTETKTFEDPTGAVYVSYPRVADTGYVTESNPKDYPRRAAFEEAVQDAQKAWHEHGQHLRVYEIGPDGAVKEAGNE